MRVYEEYSSFQEKRQAQRGAKRGKPTGKARGYCFVFDENGQNGRGFYDCRGPVMGDAAPGAGPDQTGMAGSICSPKWLSACCRRVGGKYLPKAWRKLWEEYRKPDEYFVKSDCTAHNLPHLPPMTMAQRDMGR